jgi:hypothetical protein
MCRIDIVDGKREHIRSLERDLRTNPSKLTRPGSYLDMRGAYRLTRAIGRS